MKGMYDPEASGLEVTEKRCLECGSAYGDDATICVVCDENGDDPHLLESFHVTNEPQGYMDDEDYRVLGQPSGVTLYEYPVNEED